jgi:hypothetical protein
MESSSSTTISTTATTNHSTPAASASTSSSMLLKMNSSSPAQLTLPNVTIQAVSKDVHNTIASSLSPSVPSSTNNISTTSFLLNRLF